MWIIITLYTLYLVIEISRACYLYRQFPSTHKFPLRVEILIVILYPFILLVIYSFLVIKKIIEIYRKYK